MSAESENFKQGTIVYPEIEALRYVIAEQKKQILELQDKLYHATREISELKYLNEGGSTK